MKINSVKICIAAILFFSINTFASSDFALYSKQLQNSKQLIVVIVKNQNSAYAKIQLWQRANTKSAWHKYGTAFPAVIGKNGSTKNKQEGDNKTPEGLFPISTAFGFATQGSKLTKMPYIQITPTTVCVDDPNSKFYNHIIDTKSIKSDWHSYEPMTLYSTTYALGLVIGSNINPATPGKGSCIFLHIWIDQQTPTPGCIAISKDNMQKIFAWLQPAANPKVLIKTIHQRLQYKDHASPQ